jgi:hypothetical protein
MMWAMMSEMSIVIAWVDANGRRIRGILDPWGSFFDAAGDFDRLFPDDLHRKGSESGGQK